MTELEALRELEAAVERLSRDYVAGVVGLSEAEAPWTVPSETILVILDAARRVRRARHEMTPLTPKKVTLASGVEVTIDGPFAPGEMSPEMQKQWDELKRTGIGPNDPDF